MFLTKSSGGIFAFSLHKIILEVNRLAVTNDDFRQGNSVLLNHWIYLIKTSRHCLYNFFPFFFFSFSLSMSYLHFYLEYTDICYYNQTVLASVFGKGDTVICQAYGSVKIGVPSVMTLNVQSDQLGVGREMPIYPVFPEVGMESQQLLPFSY